MNNLMKGLVGAFGAFLVIKNKDKLFPSGSKALNTKAWEQGEIEEKIDFVTNLVLEAALNKTSFSKKTILDAETVDVVSQKGIYTTDGTLTIEELTTALGISGAKLNSLKSQATRLLKKSFPQKSMEQISVDPLLDMKLGSIRTELRTKVAASLGSTFASEKDSALLAQYNSIFGQAAPQVSISGKSKTAQSFGFGLGGTADAPPTAQSVSKAQSASLGFGIGGTVDSAPQAQSVSKAKSSSFGFGLGGTADAPPTAQSVSKAPSASLGFGLGSGVADQAPSASSTQSSKRSSGLGFGAIPSFEEFKSNPSKYRK